MNPLAEKPCTKCHRLQPLTEYHKHPGGRDGRDSRCRTCESQRRKRETVRHPCVTGCGRTVGRGSRCHACRVAHQHAAEARLTAVAPRICGFPVRGGRCGQALDDGTLDGRGTVYCAVHGERYAPVIRPANFVRYDQRERLEAEIRALKVTTPVDPERRRTAVSIAKAGNFVVIGQALSRRIHAA